MNAKEILIVIMPNINVSIIVVNHHVVKEFVGKMPIVKLVTIERFVVVPRTFWETLILDVIPNVLNTETVTIIELASGLNVEILASNPIPTFAEAEPIANLKIIKPFVLVLEDSPVIRSFPVDNLPGPIYVLPTHAGPALPVNPVTIELETIGRFVLVLPVIKGIL